MSNPETNNGEVRFLGLTETEARRIVDEEMAHLEKHGRYIRDRQLVFALADEFAGPEDHTRITGKKWGMQR